MDWGNIFSQTITQAIGWAAVVYCLAAVGLNVHFGYTGLLNFGQAGFLAVAAYGLAVTVSTFNLPFFLGIVIGLIAAVLLALLLGIPTLRLRADYLAIVTIAASEIIRLLVRSVTFKDTFGGSDGLQRFGDGFYAINPFGSGLNIGPLSFSKNDLWIVVVGWTLVALTSLLVWLLMRSPWGRVIKGIREDEDAVRSLGKNVYAYKMQSLVLGGVIGALGGFVFATYAQAVQPDNYATELTFFAYTMLILGGAARVAGPILGAIVFWALITFVGEFLNEATASGIIPSSILRTDQVGQIRFMLVGLGLMLLMIFRPQGILGDKKELALDARR
jgi:branched-chain amino acid transport system permease protein